jgi:type IV pilus assembly protein PilQ
VYLPQVLRVVDTTITIPTLDFTSVSLPDALRALARSYSIPLFIDSSVTGSITLRLDDVSLNDAMAFIVSEYGLSWERSGEIIKIYRPIPEPPEPEPLDIQFESDSLSVNISEADLAQLVDTLMDLTSSNIVVERGTRGQISGRLSRLPLEQALQVLFESNGFVLRRSNGIYYVGSDNAEGQNKGRSSSLDIKCESGMVNLEVSNSPLSQVVSALAAECDASLSLQTDLQGSVTARFRDKTLEQALTYILMDSDYSFRRVGDVFFIGAKGSEDIFDSKLVRLKHLIATTTLELIPASLTKDVAAKVVPEHNGLVLTGPMTSIALVEAFIDKIDQPVAQVLFEVLVVDYTRSEDSEFGITANNFGADSGLPGQIYYPMIDISGTGDSLNSVLRSLERHLGWSNLGTLDSDFFIRLRMMQQEGRANVRSHPQIAAMNSHPASIVIGTTQYYLLESTTSYLGQGTSEPVQTAQRFETITAEMNLEVIPYVNQNRELTVEIKAEFGTPTVQFDPDIPPTINRRLLTSMVTLRDGETIVLGGLVQDTESKTIRKFPILGSLPIIGRLFQNHISSDVKSELMVYITPHVYYGSEGAVNIDSLIIIK